jgi:hypothetical protein
MKNKALWLIFSIILLAGSAFSQIAPKPPFDSLGRRASDAAAGTCNSARKGYRYYNTTSNVWEFCNGTAWGSLGGGSGITTGTTTSTGTTLTFLKTVAGVVQSSIVTEDATGNINIPSTKAFQIGTVGMLTSDGSDTQIGSAAQTGTRLHALTYIRDFINNTAVTGTISSGFNLTSSGVYGFVSSTDTTVAPDTGLTRTAAKVIKVTDGSSGSGWIQDGGVSRVSSPVTNITATPAAITGLSSTLAAGRKYAGTITLIAKNSTAAEGLQFDFNGGSATFTNVQFLFTATPIGSTLGVTTSSAIGTALTATTATTTDIAYTIYFTCVVNAAGTVIPRFAEVSHTSGTATIGLGSSMILNDIP